MIAEENADTKVQFKQHLWGCLSNIESCFCAWCFPCISVGHIADEVGENFLLCCVFQLVLPYGPIIFLRERVRQLKNIEGSFAEDVLAGVYCTCCAISQCHAELDIHIMR
ncbi:hypothetical protein RF11_04108 [Thelohanellus kitauei]|uniref:Protein PLANT CADMIUM RESISTANCE 3 n=1 Tax=Thelohanellus kitauei TaxID=669202 RepID=A0A0C2MN86_THEKT|nr:hypothetical protein RF11_04108 [Thelohanellus kitauei]